MTKIISIVNQKGGTGKSACTANYGVGLAQMKKKVLVVDVDPQFDLSASQNVSMYKLDVQGNPVR